MCLSSVAVFISGVLELCRKTQISLSLGVARIFGKVSVYFLWGICGSKTLPDRFKMRGTLASSFLRAGDGARSRDLDRDW